MKASNMDAKRQKLPATLFMVATPIGNLSDVSARCREVLSLADWVACEDTRRTAQLYSALGLVQPRLKRFDAHTDPAQIRRWAVEMIENYQQVACVTDAGTPGVSDPGALFVQEALRASEEKIRVVPIPGPSCWTALVSISGWPEVKSWRCGGFFPRKSTERRSLWLSLKSQAQSRELGEEAWLWLESPERVLSSLGDLQDLAYESEWLVAKELTKIHERVFRGNFESVYAEIREHLESQGALGEWCFAVRFPRVVPGSSRGLSKPDEASSLESGLESGLDSVLECLLDAGIKTSEIARIVSHRIAISREKAYSRVLELKKVHQKI